MQTLIKNWWLLALSGVIYAMISTIYLVMQNANGPLTFRSWGTTVAVLGKLTVAAGLCTIAAGVMRSSKGKCWLLVLNGLALSALGVIYLGFVRFRISFLAVALLVIVAALSIGVLELFAARTFRTLRHIADEWVVALAGAISVGFALAFLLWGFGLALGRINVEPGSHADLLWLGFYFGFSAICLVALGLRLHGLRGFAPGLNARTAN
jgi:uncharacterized membrane protein HdeD (DUF308 family)